MNKQLVVVSQPTKLNVKKNTKKNQNKKSKNKNSNDIFDVIEIPRAKSYKVKNKQSMINGKRSFTVKHREFIQNLYSPTTGNSNNDLCSFKLMYAAHVNPGNNKLFPWLNAMSYNFECYKFKSIKFIYKPICNTDVTGTVFIAMDYDPDDALYESKVQMMSAKSAVSGQPWTPIIHKPDNKDYNKEKTYYISHRAFENQSSNSLKLLDVGIIQVGVESAKGNQLLGELYVDYEMEFITPELNVHEILNSFQSSASQNKTISANNDSVLGTLSENKNLLIQLAKSGLTLAKGIAGNKGDLLRNIFGREMKLLITGLSTGSSRPTIIKKVFQQASISNYEINNETLESLGITELFEEAINNNFSNLEDITSTNIVEMLDHNVLTASQVYQFAVKLPQDGILHIYPGGAYGIDYSIFNVQEISEESFNNAAEHF